jgi:hypothetical protein
MLSSINNYCLHDRTNTNSQYDLNTQDENLDPPSIRDGEQYFNEDPSQNVTDIPAKPNSTAELVCNTSELKVTVLVPSFSLTITYYN